MKSTLLAVMLALFAAGASAQVIFTTVDPDGHKIFSDRAGATAEPVLEAAPESDAVKAPRRRSLVPSRLSATVNASEAERRLAQTQQKRRLGKSPLAGEGVHTPAGFVPNARYWSRQQKLRVEVEQAQRRSNTLRQTQLAHQ
jgi:hypothetical protein